MTPDFLCEWCDKRHRETDLQDGWQGYICGNRPVQGKGKVDGFPWYFRSRYDTWSFNVSLLLTDGDPFAIWYRGSEPGFRIERKFCASPDVGWIKKSTAWTLIEVGVDEFRAWLQTRQAEDLAKLPLASVLRVQELQKSRM